jgi:hypothetical protein
MAYLGSTPEYQSFTSGTDYFNGDGISVAFTLSRPVASVNDIEVVISNVVQQPSTAYSVSGTTITFTSAPPSGTANVYARYMSTATQTITPSPGTVGTSQLSSSLTNVPFFGGSTIGAGNATGMKNRIINGGMVLDQRNGGASISVSSGGNGYPVDRFHIHNRTGTGVFSGQQTTASAPVGYTNVLSVTTTTAQASLGSTEYGSLRHSIEGFNTADFNWGTANAKTVTLSFWVRSSLTGSFGGSLINTAFNRSYPFAYTISTADAWQKISLTIVGDTSGSWATNNTTGIHVFFGLGAGSTYSGPAGAWAGATYYSATGATSVVGTSGATFYVTGVQLEEGNAATSFEFRPYGTELALAQRYYVEVSKRTLGENIGIGYWFSSTQLNGQITFPVTMRTAPALNSTSGANYYGIDYNNGSYSGVTGWTIYRPTPYSAMIYSGGLSTGVTGYSGQLFNGNAASMIAFSAEL